jgi:hypothetical protein
MPQQVTRFCPSCLAEDPGAMLAAWSLPATFFCLRHDQVLAGQCPHCGRKPALPRWPELSWPACCGVQHGCGTSLAARIPDGAATAPTMSSSPGETLRADLLSHDGR